MIYKKPRLFILDFMSMAFRYHHAMNQRPLFTSAGFPTSSLFGVFRALFSIMEKERPEHMVVASDSPEPTFRHKIYSAYKAQRVEMPAELAAQIPKLYELVELLGVPLVRQSGVEADDIIATLARQASEQGYQIFIVSGDKDMMQLVGDNIRLYQTLPHKNQAHIVGAQQVWDYFGVAPKQVICAQSLIGDPTDNVPGVAGIGKARAAKLLELYHSLDGIYENLPIITPAGMQKRLAAGREQAFLSRQLVTLKSDLDLTLDEAASQVNYDLWGQNHQALDRFLCRCEFRSLHQKYFPHSSLAASTPPFAPEGAMLPSSAADEPVDLVAENLVSSSAAPPVLAEKFSELCSDQDWQQFLELSCHAFQLSFVLMIKEGSPLMLEPRGIAVSLLLNDPKALVPSRAGYYARWGEEGASQAVRQSLSKLFHGSTISIITYDLKQGLHGLRKILGCGITPTTQWEDVMVQGSLVQALGGHPSPAFLARDQGADPQLASFLAQWEKEIQHAKSTPDQWLQTPLMEYFLWCAELCGVWHQRLSLQLEALEMSSVYHLIEKPLIPILAAMEHRGVYVDRQALQEFSRQLAKQQNILEERIHRRAGEIFNIQSPKQMSAILYDKHQLHIKYGIKNLKKTSGGYSTRESVLLKMADEPLVVDILEYRKIAKIKGTYADALPQLIHPSTHRIHTSYLQNGTATGRMSSRDPNLQNIPIRSSKGREIRRAFAVQHPDYMLVSADYSQIELRVLAHMSEDVALQQAFCQHDDVHKTTAAVMLGKQLEDVDERDRNIAKAINYGIIYGMGAQKLARIIDVPLARARMLMNQYFTTFSRVAPFMEQQVEWARAYGHTRTLYGRRRTLVEIHDPSAPLRANAENAAKNSPIQGSAADLMKMAMIKVYAQLQEKGLENTMLMQVHDELVFEVPKNALDEACHAIRRGMEEVVQWQVPVVVSLGWGNHWLEAH